MSFCSTGYGIGVVVRVRGALGTVRGCSLKVAQTVPLERGAPCPVHHSDRTSHPTRTAYRRLTLTVFF